MLVSNADLLQAGRTVKFILNGSAIVFLAVGQQHRDVKLPGLSYEDDYQGNAVAGLVTPQRVEIRFHRDYSDDRIRRLWIHVSLVPELASLRCRKLYYQGREIHWSSHAPNLVMT